ncbi:hypothetical protein [Tardiphaga robiniae]|uniref:Uncharacterized protein n=1 Tax=Tardiphaga robiniae TaxID=943830 RepID=A0A163Z191_9BRAD|nr:hypothetical protein [Tardiphaga robiniae]KZD22805.1 hypothetical protein A4A58_28105 [Tardiphaga robiniae]
MDKVREILLFFAATMAVFALICALYQAMNDRVSAAALLSTIFLVCVLVVYLPKLEILEAWGVKAHLVRTLNEADEILAKLRRLAVINAKSTYETVGIGQRWDGQSAVENQARLDEINAQLIDFGVAEVERRELAKTYVRLMGFDLYMHYVQTLDRYFNFKANALRMQGDREKNEAMKAEAAGYDEVKANWKPKYNLFSQLATYSLEEELTLATPTKQLSENDRKAVEAFKNQIVRLFKDTETKAGLTKEAASYLDTYKGTGGQDKRIIELFGFNPSEVR